MKKYDPQKTEAKWQKVWQETGIYKTPENPKNPYYGLVMFAYPSGNLHCGHWYPFTGGDILARFARMKGHDVLHTNGFDAFGLPAENAAIKRGLMADKWTDENIAAMNKQYAAMGNMYDWDRMIDTSKPEYYKWTQWLFLELYKAGKAYQKEAMVNWDPVDQTVLANEQVINGKADRSGAVVEKKMLKQWFFKITDYADDLIRNLDTIDWPDKIKQAQINWIGRSHGSLVRFPIPRADKNDEFRSYIMGVGKIVNDLEAIGVEIVKKSGEGNLSVRIPNSKIGEYEKLIKHKMKAGFWNEYVGAEKTVFLFKHKTHKVDRVEWTMETESKILELCNDFAHERFDSVFGMLNDNSWYHNFVPSFVDVYTTRIDTLYSGTFLVLAPEHPLAAQLTSENQKRAVEKYVDQAASKTDTDRLEAKEKTGVFTGSYAVNPASGDEMPIWIADFVLASYGTGAVFADGHDERDVELATKYNIPLKTSIDPITGSPQKNPEHKDKIVAVVENAKGEILTVNWGQKLGGRLLVGGSIEEGEDPIQTAKREIAEESGYTDLEFIEMGDETIHHEYFAHSKKKAFIAHTKPVYFKLASDKKQAQNLEDNEKGKFKIEWVSKKLVDGEVTDPLHRYVYDKFIEHKVFTGDGILFNSGQFNGLTSEEARDKITNYLAKKGLAQKTTQYRLRDWLISRQRYWGAPIPIIHCEKCGTVPVPKSQLPVVLPLGQKMNKSGRSPLLKSSFVNTACPECSGPAKRETDTMDTFVDSSWYYLRYPNPHYNKGPFDPESLKQWLPVSTYIGGPEHATMHLLYVRFIAHFLYEQKLIPMNEPLPTFICNGLIQGPDGNKMSKSKGNVVDPDEYVVKYGADSVRLYMMFMGAYEDGGPWDPKRFEGAHRFINRVYSLVTEKYTENGHDSEREAELENRLHKTIKKVSEDIPKTHFNTAIAALMELVNALITIRQEGSVSNEAWHQSVATTALLLAPIAPHIAEEVWEYYGNDESIHLQAWPEYDEKLVKDDIVTVVIQINGKLRGKIAVAVEDAYYQDELETLAREAMIGKISKPDILKVIVVPGKLVNFVVKK